MNVVGHTVPEDGISPAAKEVNDIVNFPLPADVNSLRSFLGMASNNRNFLYNFSVVTVPLYVLLKKGVQFSL